MADRFGYGEIGLDIHPCRGCEAYDAPDGCKSNGGCGKPTTNADRLRAMTDEGIEDWYWWMHKEMMRYTDSRVFVHDWLKSPVEVDNGETD